MTAHRRENFGTRLHGYLAVTRDFIERMPDAVLILPVHPNPEVAKAVNAILGKHERMELIEPLVYSDFLLLLQSAALALSDSGGVQEEIAVVGTPLIVLRNTSERPEILATGRARLAREPAELERMLSAITHDGWPENSPLPHNPFGDGYSGERIADLVTRFVAG
jgi:UDP-N-acetylglucosamine 2-epimerase (non-hydrolysing)